MGSPAVQARVPQCSAWTALRKVLAGLPSLSPGANVLAASQADATGLLPESGTAVWVSKRSRGRHRARIVSSFSDRVFVAFETNVLRLRRGAHLDIEWADSSGVVRRRGRLVSDSAVGTSAAELELEGPPSLVQRREEIRVAVELPLSAWSFQDWTRLLEGRTVDLSESGALVHLPRLSRDAKRIDLRLHLQDGPLPLTAWIVRREADDRVAVSFEECGHAKQKRLQDFLAAHLREAAFSVAA
jgi:PilZ domain-containing protein